MIGLEPREKMMSEVVSARSQVVRVPPRKPIGGRRRKPWRLIGVLAAALVVLTAAVAFGVVPRIQQERSLQEAAQEAATAAPHVTVAQARRAPADSSQVLPGNARPLLEASLFARATGYIKTRSVDIGDVVKEGQLLAVIDSPDIDDQLAQARANLDQARATLKLTEANANLAKVVLDRSIRINSKGIGVVSPEEIDTQKATLATTTASVENAKASIRVMEATVQRYTDLQAFEKIVAPFPGVITARHIETGDLVSADSTTRELYHLMRTDVLRVFVNVPQVYATNIKVGQTATVYRRENEQKQFTGKVTRTADALDPNTRTLLTEVQVPNPDNVLRPGMFLQVKFTFERDVVPVLVPAASVITRTAGPRVAILDGEQRIQYRDVRLGRDFGAEIEVVSGLKPGETVLVRPGDDLPAGTTVTPVAAR